MKLRTLGLAGCAAVVALTLEACFAHDEPPQAVVPDLYQPLQFMFGTLDGSELSSDTTRGRTTALLFVTTYDMPSQAEAQLLRDELQTHKPLANGAIVMMEPPHSAPLAQVWADSIGLKLPVAMATPSLMAGESQLGRVAGVPTLIVLDRQGRLVAKSEGALTREQIGQCLTAADAR